jgi:hypothetical protein
MKIGLQMPLKTLCAKVPVAYSSLRRWRQRQRQNQPPVQKPGPKKLGPLPLETLQREIAKLKHGARRTEGTGALHHRYEVCISRRDLDDLVRESRLEAHRRERESRQRVEWLVPDLVWAIDTTEWERDAEGRRLYAHGSQDLCSRYHFEPWAGQRNWGTDAATWLRQSFQVRPPPLLLKRDNGSPLNHPAVDAVLAEYQVIPLNSPPHYPRYNGAKERGFRELKKELGPDFRPAPLWRPRDDLLAIAVTLHHLNHRPRPCLQGRVPCAVQFGGTALRFLPRERQAIFNSILNDFRERISREQRDIPDHRWKAPHGAFPYRHPAWRQAVESWLRCQGLIRVTLNNNQEVSTHFDLQKCS